MRENREFASELKFLISPVLAEIIRDWARARLRPDPNAGGECGDEYRISSLYFDTERSDVFHRRGSYGRSKLRIRRYGQADTVFLERKLRTRGLLAKRRSLVAMEELKRLTEDRAERGWGGFWFHRRLLARELQPVCQVTYERTARYEITPCGPIRLTLDNNLLALPAEGMGFSRQEGALILEARVVLELKFRREMPVLFKNLISEFVLHPQPFSKFRLAASALGLAVAAPAEHKEELVAHYA
jgi:hypothetical protein